MSKNWFKSILLIEDDPITNFINEKLIAGFNITDKIFIKKSGEEALTFLDAQCSGQQDCPELIFLDINMPVLDGFEFMLQFRSIQSTYSLSPDIVILSTSSHEFDRERFLNLGVIHFIQKPLTREKLSDILKAL